MRFVTEAARRQSEETELHDAVSEQLEKLNKLQVLRASFVEEMEAKERANQQKDEEGKKLESLQLQKIKDIQAQRPKVLTEIDRLSKKTAWEDAVRQRKVDAINEDMDVLEVNVDGHERPVISKKSGGGS